MCRSDLTVRGPTVSSSNQYDADGNVLESVDADGKAIVYNYNNLDQETGETWYPTAADASSGSDGTESFGYDLDGQMIAACDATVSGGTPTAIANYTYQYDTMGDQTATNIQLGGVSSNVVLSSAYDAEGNRTSLAANIGGTLGSDGSVTSGIKDFLNSYSYDLAGDMTGVTQTAQTGGTDNGVTSKNVTMAYNYNGQMTGIVLYQSSTTSDEVASGSLSYDKDSNLTDLTYTDASSNVLAAYHWSYDTDSRVSDEYSLSDTSGSTTFGAGYATWATTAYGYDDDSQLTGTSYTTFANAPTSNTSATLDANGNRTSTNSVSEASSTNRLLFDGTFYYNYDPAGNRTAKFESTSGLLDSSATNITIYAWDNANELVSAKTYDTYAHYIANDTPSSEVDYTNDPFGQMVSRTVKDSSGTVTESDNYIYDGGNPVLVLNADGQVTQRNLYGPAVDQIMASEAVTPVMSGAQSAGTVSWMLPDNQGTVRDVAQFSGSSTSIVDHVILDSFGAISGQVSGGTYTAGAPTTSPLVFSMNGALYDPATGTYVMGLRRYDPNTGNWLSQDPDGFGAGQTNLEEYVGNNPTNFVDSLGLFADPDFNQFQSSGDASAGAAVGILGGGGSGGGSGTPVYGGGNSLAGGFVAGIVLCAQQAAAGGHARVEDQNEPPSFWDSWFNNPPVPKDSQAQWGLPNNGGFIGTAPRRNSIPSYIRSYGDIQVDPEFGGGTLSPEQLYRLNGLLENPDNSPLPGETHEAYMKRLIADARSGQADTLEQKNKRLAQKSKRLAEENKRQAEENYESSKQFRQADGSPQIGPAAPEGTPDRAAQDAANERDAKLREFWEGVRGEQEGGHNHPEPPEFGLVPRPRYSPPPEWIEPVE